MLGRTVKMAFWVVYDHIGKLLLAGVWWAVLFWVPLLGGLWCLTLADVTLRVATAAPLLLGSIFVTGPAGMAAFAHMVKELIETRDGSVRTWLEGLRLYAVRAVGLAMFLLVCAGLLSSSVGFYAVWLRDRAPWLGFPLSGLTLWGLLFVLLIGLFVWPALVQKRGGVLATLKLAGVLTMGHPFFATGLLILVGLWTLVTMKMPILILLYGGIVAALVSSAYELLARRYAEQQGEPPVADEDDDYLNRGFRDFLFPWKH